MSAVYFNLKEEGVSGNEPYDTAGKSEEVKFLAYKELRRRELTLHRLMIEVFEIQSVDYNNVSPQLQKMQSATKKVHMRMLEDLRDLCSISAEVTEIEQKAIKYNKEVQEIKAAKLLGDNGEGRALFFDGIDDVTLDRESFIRLGNCAKADDGGRVRLIQGGKTELCSTTDYVHGRADVKSYDATSIYLHDINNQRKKVEDITKELVSDRTTPSRVQDLKRLLVEKQEMLIELKRKIQSENSKI
eukprot:Tbor_TRINITY_DN2375_c0_g2::TRINITY_DN2375_c0_g2_i1::g.161::m.161